MDAVLREFAAGELYLPLRSVVRPPQSPGLMGLMTAHRAGDAPAFGLKAVAIFPENPKRGLDAHQGVVIVFDGEDGHVRGLSMPPPITAIRTAAVSAVATRALAREGASTLAVLGCRRAGRGAHRGHGLRAAARARAHLLAPPRARARARGDDRRALRRGTRAPPPRSRTRCARPTSSCTTTTAREPIVERGWLAPGTHVNAVGSSIPTTRELDGASDGRGAHRRRRARVRAQRVRRHPARDARGSARRGRRRSPSSARC